MLRSQTQRGGLAFSAAGVPCLGVASVRLSVARGPLESLAGLDRGFPVDTPLDLAPGFASAPGEPMGPLVAGLLPSVRAVPSFVLGAGSLARAAPGNIAPASTRAARTSVDLRIIFLVP